MSKNCLSVVESIETISISNDFLCRIFNLAASTRISYLPIETANTSSDKL